LSNSNDVALARHRSRFARHAGDLDPRVLSALRIDAVLLQFCDVVVTVCSILSDATDPRPWQERLDDAFRHVEADSVVAGLEDIAASQTQAAVDTWVRKVRTVGYKAFARRLLGAATYDQLEHALYEDAAVVALAVRRGVRAAMPFVVAWEDALAVMSREQLSTLTSIDVLGLNVGKLIHDLDALLGDRVLPALPVEVVAAHSGDLVSLNELTGTVRAAVSSGALRQLTRVSEPLVRKLAGARDALEYSADGVSQAASSLVELIDRVIRESVDEATALAWIDSQLRDNPDLTYLTPAGLRRPTKRGELLCLVYAGGSVSRPATEQDDGSGPSFVHQVLVGVIVSPRTRLQHLKHADDASEDDREQLKNLLSAIEGALMLSLLLQQLTVAPSQSSESPELEPA